MKTGIAIIAVLMIVKPTQVAATLQCDSTRSWKDALIIAKTHNRIFNNEPPISDSEFATLYMDRTGPIPSPSERFQIMAYSVGPYIPREIVLVGVTDDSSFMMDAAKLSCTDSIRLLDCMNDFTGLLTFSLKGDSSVSHIRFMEILNRILELGRMNHAEPDTWDAGTPRLISYWTQLLEFGNLMLGGDVSSGGWEREYLEGVAFMRHYVDQLKFDVPSPVLMSLTNPIYNESKEGLDCEVTILTSSRILCKVQFFYDGHVVTLLKCSEIARLSYDLRY